MRSASKRGRRSRPSSLALEDQQEVPLKRTRSSPAVPQSKRLNTTHPARRQDHPPRPLPSSGSHTNKSSQSDTINNKEPSPIPEVPYDDDSSSQMLPDSKPATRVESVKRRGSRDSKRAATPQASQSEVLNPIDDMPHSDLSSLSELDDSEAETERLEDSPQKGAPKSVLACPQSGSKPLSLKTTTELKVHKEVDTATDEGAFQLLKKRKRENYEVTQKEVKVEERTSRPVTPLTGKSSVSLEKVKKNKSTEVSQEKAVIIPMEGVETGLAITNGDGSPPHENHTEPEAPVITAGGELREEKKDPPRVDVDGEVDDEGASEVVEIPREDDEDLERLQKRKEAADAYIEIELEFAKLCDKLYEERISHIDEEIRLVNEGTHPELMAMMEAVNKRRDDKIRLYNTQLRYALQSHHTTMKATRAQLHSQYSQQVREIRELYLERVSEDLYQIQRERRASDMLVQDFTYRISEDRATRIRERQAYNMEVQILSGIAKYIGFPAAPEVKGATPNEMQQDLEAMGIVSRVPVRGTNRGIDDHPEQLQRSHWGSKTAPLSPPLHTSTHHHHHHHPHTHTHHHHISHQEQPIARRVPVGSTSISTSTMHMSPVTPLPLSALLQDSQPIKLEQATHSSSGLHPPSTSIVHASRSPLHHYRPQLTPQAHIHQLQQHLHQGYGPRGSSLDPGEREMEGRGRVIDDKDIALGQIGIVRYAPVGKGYV